MSIQREAWISRVGDTQRLEREVLKDPASLLRHYVRTGRPAREFLERVREALARRDGEKHNLSEALDLFIRVIRFNQIDGLDLTLMGPEPAISDRDFSGAYLEGAILEGLRFVRCNFSSARLVDANCTGTRFENCRATEANLERAVLRDARLIQSDLSGASLAGALVEGAQFQNCEVTSEQLSQVAGAYYWGRCSALEFDQFFDGYTEALFFDWEGDRMEEFGVPDGADLDIDSSSERQMRADCTVFINETYPWIRHNMDLAGHDFYMTRMGHGVGFWDREEIWGEHADELSRIAQNFPEESVFPYEDSGGRWLLG